MAGSRNVVGIYREGGKLLAEFSAVCVEHLGALGKSLYSEARYKRKDRSFQWPASPLDTAQLLRREVSPIISALTNSDMWKS